MAKFTGQMVKTVTAKDFLYNDVQQWVEFEHDGNNYLVQLVHDPDAENPREWDNLFTLTTTKGAGHSDDKAIDIEEFEEMTKEERDEFIIFPLGLHRHSQDYLYVGKHHADSDPMGFDSGQCGLAYVKKDTLILNFQGVTEINEHNIEEVKARAHKILNAELDTYNLWLAGEVYGCVILQLNAEDKNTDAIWGFEMGSRKEMIEIVAGRIRETVSGITREKAEKIAEALDSPGGYYEG